jgi:hypothetical protein
VRYTEQIGHIDLFAVGEEEVAALLLERVDAVLMAQLEERHHVALVDLLVGRACT